MKKEESHPLPWVSSLEAECSSSGLREFAGDLSERLLNRQVVTLAKWMRDELVHFGDSARMVVVMENQTSQSLSPKWSAKVLFGEKERKISRCSLDALEKSLSDFSTDVRIGMPDWDQVNEARRSLKKSFWKDFVKRYPDGVALRDLSSVVLDSLPAKVRAEHEVGLLNKSKVEVPGFRSSKAP